jgi:hypothetical protein
MKINQQRKQPAKRAFAGLAGSPLAHQTSSADKQGELTTSTNLSGGSMPNSRYFRLVKRAFNNFKNTPGVNLRNLRSEYSLTPRQLVPWLDDKQFNESFQVNEEQLENLSQDMQRWYKEIQEGKGKSVYRTVDNRRTTIWRANRGSILVRPSTMAEWRSLLPLKTVTILTDPEKEFYRDYTNRNLTKEEMTQKYGDVSDEQLCALENRMIRRAMWLNLPPVRIKDIGIGFRPDDYERDREEGWQLEVKGLAKGRTFIGEIHGTNDPGDRPLRDFRTGTLKYKKPKPLPKLKKNRRAKPASADREEPGPRRAEDIEAVESLAESDREAKADS